MPLPDTIAIGLTGTEMAEAVGIGLENVSSIPKLSLAINLILLEFAVGDQFIGVTVKVKSFPVTMPMSVLLVDIVIPAATVPPL